jgi:hypothetical protein
VQYVGSRSEDTQPASHVWIGAQTSLIRRDDVQAQRVIARWPECGHSVQHLACDREGSCASRRVLLHPQFRSEQVRDSCMRLANLLWCTGQANPLASMW